MNRLKMKRVGLATAVLVVSAGALIAPLSAFGRSLLMSLWLK